LFLAALLLCCGPLGLTSVSGSSSANLLFGALTTPLVPLNSLPPLSPAIPLSTTYDCTLEGAGRTGNALRMQDAHAYLSTSAPLFTSHPAGVPAITFSMWFQQQVPSNIVSIFFSHAQPAQARALLPAMASGGSSKGQHRPRARERASPGNATAVQHEKRPVAHVLALYVFLFF
jgi:hypothetical protein